MKRFLVFVLVVLSVRVSAQNLSGQWKGGFVSDGDYFKNRTEYVLELDISGEEVDGYSYTYFEIRGKRCYVICHLKGTYDKQAKSVWVKEFEKVKSNTPPEFLDCFQIHELSFVNDGGSEKLVGRWKPASKANNCGTGTTELERKTLVRVAPVAPPKQSEVVNAKPKPKATPPPVSTTKPKPKPSTTTNSTPRTTSPGITSKPVTKPKKNPPVVKPPVTKQIEEKPKTAVVDSIKREQPATASVSTKPVVREFENRSKKVLKTIVLEDDEFRVDLYDNGEIDGDSVSVFFNGKLMVTHQRLSDKPITLKIKLDPDQEYNDLVMFAENMGSIPPNTALMVVTVGDQRYEVRITSTEQTSGTVRFKLKDE